MTEEQRIVLLTALKEVHDKVHVLYPKDIQLTKSDKQLRSKLLVIDLVVHLAEEVIGGVIPNKQQVTERTANLLYAVRLIAPDYPFEQAANLLLENKKT